MKTVLHIPAWWPTQKNIHNGLFIFKFIKQVSIMEPGYCHVVAPPAKYIKWLRLAFLWKDVKDGILGVNYLSTQSSTFLNMQPFIGYSKILGFKYIDKLIKSFIGYYAKNKKPDLIHVHGSYPGLAIAYELKKTYNVPFIVTEHATRIPDDRFELHGLNIADLKKMYAAAHTVTVVSQVLVLQLNKLYGVHATCIPNFIYWPKLRLDKKQDDPFTFIMIAIVNDQRKRIDLAIKAFKILVDNKKLNIKLMIAGGGSTISGYERMAERLQLTTYIEWWGPVNEKQKQELLQKAHCLLITSDYETFAISGIEALSLGVPVISTDCGGPKDYINKFNGILIPKNDVVALSTAMELMMSNYGQYQASLIQNQVYNTFEATQVVKKYTDIYYLALNMNINPFKG